VQRDLKPSNVFVTPHGVKLLDFGPARSTVDDATATVANLTMQGQVVGTPAYMAPEQLDGSVVDHRADLFVSGALLFEMVTGRAPFAAASNLASMHAVLYERPPARTGASSVDVVDRIVRRALEKKPDDRYQTAAEMARAVAVTRLVVLPFRVLPADPDT
jgi:serine/threonine-protein kinase